MATKTKVLSFQEWFEVNGGTLLRGWLRAKEDDNDEPFADWVSGEYSCYLDMGEVWEVPYHGIFDNPSVIELLIFSA